MYFLLRKTVDQFDDLEVRYYLINKLGECINIEIIKHLNNYIWENWIECEENRCKISAKFSPESLSIISLKDIVVLLSHSDLKKYINLLAK